MERGNGDHVFEGSKVRTNKQEFPSWVLIPSHYSGLHFRSGEEKRPISAACLGGEDDSRPEVHDNAVGQKCMAMKYHST